MKTEDSFYVKILLWAYEKTSSGVGFTEDELLRKFNLKDGDGILYRLYLTLFVTGSNGDRPIIGSFYDKREGDNFVKYSCLTDKGMSSAIDYLDLKEAREGSKQAKRIALWSIWIAVVVGLIQIVIALGQLCE